MCTWVDDIREIYRRLEQWDTGWPLDQQSSAFAQSQRALEMQLRQMRERCGPSSKGDLHLGKQKVLSSLHNHWDGLTVFVERPEGPWTITPRSAVATKNYYGSGSVWSAHLAAMLFSVIQTVLLWGLNHTIGCTPSSKPVRTVVARARRTSAPSCPGR